MPLNFVTRREKHAIAEFTAVIRFAYPINLTTFTGVSQALKDVSAESVLNLPATMNVQIVQFGFGGAPPPPTAGSGRQRFAPNGEIARSVWCDLDAITITVRDYTRWHDARQLLAEGLRPIIGAYLKEVPAVRNISVQYLNEFQSHEPGYVQTGELFRPDSKWVAPFAHEVDQYWHCHVGKFLPGDANFRHLVNVNCDIAPLGGPPEQANKTMAKVLIMSACHYDMPKKGPLILSSQTLKEAILTQFDIAHSMEKKILGEVISDAYLKTMGDGANEY